MSTVYIRFASRRLDAPLRSPLLERLVARAASWARVADWRGQAFGIIAPREKPMPAIGAAAAAASTAAAGAATADAGVFACIATPVHLSAGMSSVSLPEDGILALGQEEAETLAADFNRAFAGDAAPGAVEGGAVRSLAAGRAGMRMRVGRGAVLLCLFDRALDVATHEPQAASGQDLFGFQPSGVDAGALRRLMSEMEMWLFEHAVNKARAARGLAAVTGLWLWGGGTVPSGLPAIQGWTAGQDPFFACFGAAPRYPSVAGSGVVVSEHYPGSAAWPDFERQWLAPAAAALRKGAATRLYLAAGQRCYVIANGFHWRVWRRPRPWWESFGSGEAETASAEGTDQGSSPGKDTGGG